MSVPLLYAVMIVIQPYEFCGGTISMNGDGPDETASKGWLATVLQGDWLKLPGALKAVGRLIGGTADAGTALLKIATAKAEQVERGIGDETEARSALIKEGRCRTRLN